MTRQAQNAAKFNEALLTQQNDKTKDKKKDDKNKSKEEEKSKDEDDDIDKKMLRDELLLYKARYKKSDTRCKELESELNATKQQLEKFDSLQDATKKRT
eukprot:CAMPEP_0201572784 /NCGR_PEP_ID=MMETSP0190_2-20130828/16236_1 /ASSEMBLY_ACC=CAM_ASM_000263 /TAXON_ID=37353 /ORGANISM="Rosalina sp." /LENGTH=98 /DNA_ID=CAMNT_0047998955 /DNA_START=401 /DNA_END=697 /DNA_ORIENTATION=-